MFDVTELDVIRISNFPSYPRRYTIHYIYKKKTFGIVHTTAKDELGAYQNLLKELEETYRWA